MYSQSNMYMFLQSSNTQIMHYLNVALQLFYI